MSDFFARHAEMQAPEPAVSGGVDIVRADAARSARSAAQRSGDHAAVERYDAEERQALGGADEGGGAVVEAGEDGPPDASVYGIAASRFEAADTGAYADLIQDWGRPNEAEFRANYAAAERLSGELSAKYPGLDGALNTAMYQVDGQWKPLRDNAAVMRMLGHLSRRISSLQGQSAEPANRGSRTMQNGAGSVHDQIDETRARRRVAQAEGNRRLVAELDAEERRLWAQTDQGRGGVVDGRPGGRNY